VQLVARETRRADKTGLIAWKANKYSVPMAWQQARVGVLETGSQLHISDLDTGEVIASHALCFDMGKVIKNTHHYRDHAQRVSKLEADIRALIGSEVGHRLCQQFKRSEAKIYKDQLVAARDLRKRHEPVDPALITMLAERPGMTATRLQSYLEAAQAAVLRERQPEPLPEPKQALDLSVYQRLGRSSGQGVPMSQLEQTVARYRSLRLSAAAYELTNLLAEAEANEMSYLSFADWLAEHVLAGRSQ
jgi:hypothetical protein